jgi:hypothetical protein
MPTDDSLPVLQPAEVKALTTDKFKKFFAKLDSDNAAEKLLHEDDNLVRDHSTKDIKNQGSQSHRTSSVTRSVGTD